MAYPHPQTIQTAGPAPSMMGAPAEATVNDRLLMIHKRADELYGIAHHLLQRIEPQPQGTACEKAPPIESVSALVREIDGVMADAADILNRLATVLG